MNSPVCVDASLIVRTLLPGPFSAAAETLLGQWLQEETPLMAPALLAFEVPSTIRRQVFLKAVSPESGEEAFARFLRLPLHLSNRRGILPLAWEFAKQFHLARVYDMSYMALAQLLDCEFWTADERLYNAVKERLAWVKWIGSVQPH